MRRDAARHAFLSRDSFIACHEVLRLPTQELIGDLMEDMSRIKGEVHAEVRAEIAAAVQRAPTLSLAEQAAVAQSLARAGAG